MTVRQTSHARTEEWTKNPSASRKPSLPTRDKGQDEAQEVA